MNDCLGGVLDLRDFSASGSNGSEAARLGRALTTLTRKAPQPSPQAGLRRYQGTCDSTAGATPALGVGSGARDPIGVDQVLRAGHPLTVHRDSLWLECLRQGNFF